MSFARSRGLPFSEVLTWHPRDLDTWLALEEADDAPAREAAQDERFAQLHKEHGEAMGRG